MSHPLLRAACVAVTLGLAGFAAAPAQATPFVAIRAEWDATPEWNWQQPAGAAFSCYGDAVGTGTTGCSATLSLAMSADTSTLITVTRSGGLRVTNVTDHALDGYAVFSAGFSAFNPGGPALGIGIDDPLTQWARFESAVDGLHVGDSHRCSVGFRGTSGGYVTADGHGCGVGSPDSSQNDIAIDVSTLAPGASADIFFGLSITYELALAAPPVGVPAPASAGLLLGGLAALRLRRRARKR